LVGVRKISMLNNSEKTKENATDEEFISNYLNSPKPVFIINKKGQISDVNDAFCQTVGVKSKDIVGRNFSDLYFLTDDAKKQMRYRNVSRLIGKETPYFTLDTISKNGEIISHQIDTKPLLKNGRIAGEIAFIKKTSKMEPEKYKTTMKKRIVKKDELKENMEILNAMDKIKKRDNEINKMKSELSDKYQDLITQKRQLEEINNKWRESEFDLDKRQKEIRNLRDEMERAQNKLRLKEEEIDDLKNQLKQNKTNFEEKNQELQKLGKQLEEEKKQIK